jgi:hypothetical protein
MKKLFASGLLLIGASACCNLEQPKHPIDAEQVAPLWDIVLVRYEAMTESSSLNDTAKTQYMLDADLLKAIIEKALGKSEEE